MVDIGQAAGTTEMSRVTVNEVPGTTTVIGAGTAGGPARRVDMYEDVSVHGNLQSGICKAVRFYLPDGGSLSTETPRLSTEVSNAELSIIGAGSTATQYQRKVKVYDNLFVSHDATVSNDVHVTHDVYVGNALQVTGFSMLQNGLQVTGGISATGDIYAGYEGGGWQMLRAKNAIAAAATFHFYERGSGIQTKLCTGSFGFTTGFFAPMGNTVHPPLIGIPVAMLVLDTPVLNPIVEITPWMVGRYDETSPHSPILVSPSLSAPPMLFPSITIKGLMTGPMGTNIDISGAVQQIEVYFTNLMTPFVPVLNDADLVFDIIVVGGNVSIL